MVTIYIPERHHLDKRASSLAELIEGPDDLIVRTPDAATVLGMSQQWLETGTVRGLRTKVRQDQRARHRLSARRFEKVPPLADHSSVHIRISAPSEAEEAEEAEGSMTSIIRAEPGYVVVIATVDWDDDDKSASAFLSSTTGVA